MTQIGLFIKFLIYFIIYLGLHTSLGIAVKNIEKEINIKPGIKEELTAVFVSSSPGPITGFFVLVPKSDITYLDISVEDGMKIIISGGILFSKTGIATVKNI